ncbi:hypothetical protein [Actinosynnema sp. NPDC020468]|uniref:hypothetical protein n=1 Tax=Actinosynnema sp. NPDC020468 TaxID=3154488 RepID=UPI0033FC4739
MTYRIDLTEMDAHAKKLDDIAHRVNTAAGAGQASSHPEAFGLLGIPLMAICAAAEHSAVDTLNDAVDAASDHLERVHDWREDVRTNEEANTTMFDGMYTE